MRVIVVRHYRTVNNETKRIMGWGDAPPAEDWEDDLLAVDKDLRAARLEFDAFYSSALGRARQTARYFVGKRGGAMDVQSQSAFNEVNYGEFFGLSKQVVAERCRQYKKDPDFVFPGGESFHQMQRRSSGFLLELEARHAADNLLLVAHAGVIRALICRFLGLEFEPNLRRKVSHRYIGDFMIANGVCARYDELGRPSGFVKDGVIEVPWASSAGGNPAGASLPSEQSSVEDSMRTCSGV